MRLLFIKLRVVHPVRTITSAAQGRMSNSNKRQNRAWTGQCTGGRRRGGDWGTGEAGQSKRQSENRENYINNRTRKLQEHQTRTVCLFTLIWFYWDLLEHSVRFIQTHRVLTWPEDIASVLSENHTLWGKYNFFNEIIELLANSWIAMCP